MTKLGTKIILKTFYLNEINILILLKMEETHD